MYSARPASAGDGLPFLNDVSGFWARHGMQTLLTVLVLAAMALVYFVPPENSTFTDPALKIALLWGALWLLDNYGYRRIDTERIHATTPYAYHVKLAIYALSAAWIFANS
jgi:hypothetical protein